MKFYSTNNKALRVSLRDAVLQGLAPDKGLYMPERIPSLPAGFLDAAGERSLQEIAFVVAREFVSGDIDDNTLSSIISHALPFDAPVVSIEDNVYALELFHGPTFAFKDFGARFMAGLLGHFAQQEGREVVILVATSGDTGSAVANGFLRVPGTRVVVLYPRGKVSEIQEKQFTTLGHNITALEVDGTFDDCQRLVKEAFVDPDLTRSLFLTSANSINVARLIPQSFYYIHAYAQLRHLDLPIVFAVPSGNFGNLTAGLLAMKMGLPVAKFVACTNVNDVVPEYLESGMFNPRPSIQTISNAMDVGNPSNFARMLDLYNNDREAMAADLYGCSFTDEETRDAMRDVYARTGYVLDPHGAVGYLGIRSYLCQYGPAAGVFLETAHPGKFRDVVEETLDRSIELPEGLKAFAAGKKQSVPMSAEFADLKEFLLKV
ncbi:MAG TPA: threonine synthase [Cyclobacteriaceae bacterium]|nr:MAG: threonine synthase [Bacteroidota bacterium]